MAKANDIRPASLDLGNAASFFHSALANVAFSGRAMSLWAADISIGFATADLVDCASSDRELNRELIGSQIASGELFPNEYDFFGGEPSRDRTAGQNGEPITCDGMSDVLFTRTPLEIFDAIVGLVEIDVVYLFAGLRWPDECSRDEAMNSAALSANGGGAIAIHGYELLHNASSRAAHPTHGRYLP